MWLDGWHNRYRTRGFLVNSLPKAGTNLLAKVLCSFPGVRTVYEELRHLDPAVLPSHREDGAEAGPGVPLGVTWPRLVSHEAVRRAFASVGRGGFISVHAPWSKELVQLLEASSMKTVLIVRDPRDVVCSAAKYIPQTPENVFHALYRPLSEADRLRLTICGQQEAAPGLPRVNSIAEACASLLAWSREPICRVVRFERLVGPSGGGSEQDQLEELQGLAGHLGLRCRERTLRNVARNAFGGTSTFRDGRVGGWRSIFDQEQRRLFEEVAGEQLTALGYERDLDG